MVPRHIQIHECGKDGLTVIDGDEHFSVDAGALEGNGWEVPDKPGGIATPVKLWVTGQVNGGLVLKDPELGHEYWVSSTGLTLAGCKQLVKRKS
jgi:hypothetical protein